MRNDVELRVLTKAIDSLLDGRSAAALDLLTQQFKAVELAHTDGHWKNARHLIVVPGSKISTLTEEEVAVLMREEKHVLERARLAAAAGGKGGNHRSGSY